MGSKGKELCMGSRGMKEGTREREGNGGEVGMFGCEMLSNSAA
jgi:hypothetical protein